MSSHFSLDRKDLLKIGIGAGVAVTGAQLAGVLAENSEFLKTLSAAKPQTWAFIIAAIQAIINALQKFVRNGATEPETPTTTWTTP